MGGIDRMAYFDHGGPSQASANMSSEAQSLYTNEAYNQLSVDPNPIFHPGVLARQISDIKPEWFNQNATIDLKGCYMGREIAPTMANHIGRGVTAWGSKGQTRPLSVGGGQYKQLSVDKYQFMPYRK